MLKFRKGHIPRWGCGLASMFLLIFQANQFALAGRGEEIIEKVQAKIASIQAMTLRFSAQIQMGGEGFEEAGRIYFAQGGRFRLESSGQTLVCDGQTLWAYTPADSQVVIFSAGAGGTPFFTPQQLLFDYPDKYAVQSVDNVKYQGLSCHLLTMTPRDETDPVANLRVWVDRREYLTHRLELEELSGNKSVFAFDNIEIRQNLPDTTFQFVPPPAMKVIDMR